MDLHFHTAEDRNGLLVADGHKLVAMTSSHSQLVRKPDHEDKNLHYSGSIKNESFVLSEGSDGKFQVRHVIMYFVHDHYNDKGDPAIMQIGADASFSNLEEAARHLRQREREVRLGVERDARAEPHNCHSRVTMKDAAPHIDTVFPKPNGLHTVFSAIAAVVEGMTRPSLRTALAR